MTKMLRATLSLLAASLLTSGCSLIVESNCGDDENNFCPTGYRCFEGRCVPNGAGCGADTECDLATSDECCPAACNEFNDVDCCLEECCCEEPSRCIGGVCREPRPEECNGADDDFDDEVDEDFDSDFDSVSSCAFVDAIPDCDDSNADVYPGNAEICDGLDNDCDGNVDDGELCPLGQRCSLMLARCEPADDCTPGECPDGMFCHADGMCYPAEVHFGDACVQSDQCLVGRCLTTAPLGVPGRRCTDICCNDSDCPPTTFCAASESGLKLCAPNTWFGGLGVSCGAMGSCPACWQRQCRLQCCSDSDCVVGCQAAYDTETPTGTITTNLCDLREITERSIGLYGESDCGQIGSFLYTYCASGYQWVVAAVLGIPTNCICSAPCCTNDDCTDGGSEPDAQCIVTESGFGMCHSPAHLGSLGGYRAFGGVCTSFEECESGVCHPDGYCSESCCMGTGCPGAALCVPTQGHGGSYANLCTIF